jgi:hypothetical protein
MLSAGRIETLPGSRRRRSIEGGHFGEVTNDQPTRLPNAASWGDDCLMFGQRML